MTSKAAILAAAVSGLFVLAGPAFSAEDGVNDASAEEIIEVPDCARLVNDRLAPGKQLLTSART